VLESERIESNRQLCKQEPCNDFENSTWQYNAIFDGDNDFSTLVKYRSELYAILGKRRDASMDLIDALACQQTAQSVTDLSEQPQFPRQYASVTDAVHYASKQQKELDAFMRRWGLESTPSLSLGEVTFRVLAVDSTPMPHLHADCLADRTVIHDASNQVTGKPINVGHKYSCVVGITDDSSWVSPICFDRIASTESDATFGIKQVISISNQTVDLCIILLDSGYNNAPCRKIVRESNCNNIYIVRSACNRKYYIPAIIKPGKRKGRPPKYGEVIDLYKPNDGANPDTTVTVATANQGYISVSYWKKTYTKMKGMNGYEDPCALIVLFEHRADHTLKYKKPMVLRVFMPEQSPFNSSDSAWLYNFRFCIERFFASKKRRLLLGHFQSPNVEHQQTFATMGSLAYQQWYLGKMSGAIQWRIKPWHRYPKREPKGEKLSPSHVQRGFGSVLQSVGTPSVFVRTRNSPPGRQEGEVQIKRERHPVIRKSKSPGENVALPESTAASMDSKTKKAAAQVAANVIKRTVENTKNAVACIAALALTLIFQYGAVNEKTNPYQTYVAKNSISLASENKAEISDGGINTRNSVKLSVFISSASRAPPETG
jgi:hypothetical protein